MNSESLFCLASCESVFSYCCPHIVVNAYCLSHFLSFLLYPPVFSPTSEAILHPSQPFKHSVFITFRDAKCHIICSAPSHVHFDLFSPLLSHVSWSLCALRVTFATTHHLSSSHIELYDSHQVGVTNGDSFFWVMVKSPLSLF